MAPAQHGAWGGMDWQLPAPSRHLANHQGCASAGADSASLPELLIIYFFPLPFINIYIYIYNTDE